MLGWLAATLLSAPAPAAECETVSFRDVIDVEAPAVIVLGERHGHQPDLRRAGRVVSRLARTAPVQVGIEAVHQRYQPVLDAFAAGRADASDLPELMDWEGSWGFRWRPYQPVVTAAVDGATVRAAGLDLGPMPEDAQVPIPPAYFDILRDAMAGHEMDPSMASGFVAAMAWRDHRIAALSAEGWSGEGYLVIVTGRGHVEGGKGVNWQVQRMVDAPVHSFVLAKGPNPPCHPGDKLWTWP